MSTIIINGKRIEVTGNNISIINDKIYVNGKQVEEKLSGIVTIKFEGDLASLKSDASVTVNGNIMGDVEADGSVSCNDVEGNAIAGGSISCDNISKNVNAGGSVNCNNVGGNIQAGGSVRYKNN